MRKLLSIIGLLLVVLPSSAGAVTSYDTFNIPPTRLKTRISTTQTTGIKLNPPSRNGADVRWPAQSGGIIFLQQGTREEYIYASRYLIGSDLTVTLSGTVIRDIPWNQARSFTGQGDGKIFTPGTAVTFVVSAQTLNLKADTDRVNNFTGSGAINCTSTSQSCLILPRVTTAQRNNFTYGNDLPGLIYDTTLGVAMYRSGGAWISFGSGAAAVIASESTAGRAQAATVANQIAKTDPGTSGAPLFVQPKYLTQSGALHGTDNSGQAGRIPILNSTGALSATFGGLGRTNSASGSLFLAQGSGAVKVLTPSTSTQTGSSVVVYRNKFSFREPSIKAVYVSGTVSSDNVNPTSLTAFDTHFYNIPANDLVNGVAYKIDCGLAVNWGAGSVDNAIMLGSTAITTVRILPTQNSQTAHLIGMISGTAAAGASVTVRGTSTINHSEGLSKGNYTAVSVATNSILKLQIGAMYTVSNGSNQEVLTHCAFTRVSSN